MQSDGLRISPTTPVGETGEEHKNGQDSVTQAKTSNKVGDLVGSFTLSYLVAGGLLVALFYYGGAWNILANTRLLDVLINGGIIRYHDMNIGYVNMVPAP